LQSEVKICNSKFGAWAKVVNSKFIVVWVIIHLEKLKKNLLKYNVHRIIRLWIVAENSENNAVVVAHLSVVQKCCWAVGLSFFFCHFCSNCSKSNSNIKPCMRVTINCLLKP